MIGSANAVALQTVAVSVLAEPARARALAAEQRLVAAVVAVVGIVVHIVV